MVQELIAGWALGTISSWKEWWGSDTAAQGTVWLLSLKVFQNCGNVALSL